MYYFVSTSGNDSYSGDVLNPFATLSRAQTVARTGDTIFFRGGTHTGYTEITKAVTISGYEDETAILQPIAGDTGAALLISTSNVTVDKLTVDAVNRKRGIDISTAANVTVGNGEVKNCYGVGEGQYGQGIVVSQDEICRNILITDMLIHHVGSTASDTLAKCHGIYTACPEMHIRNTEIHTVDSHAVHWYGSQGGDLTLEGAYLHDTRIGVGLYNGTARVFNNVIRDVLSAFWSRDNIVSALVTHNTCTDFGTAVDISALKNNDPVVRVVYANNVFHNGTQLLQAEQLTTTTATADMYSNLRSSVTDADYLGGYATAFTVSHIEAEFTPITDDGGVSIIPLHSNPAIGAGVQVAGVSTDRAGTARNLPSTLGAWQYTPPTTYLLSRGSGRATPSRSSVFSNRGLNTP